MRVAPVLGVGLRRVPEHGTLPGDGSHRRGAHNPSWYATGNSGIGKPSGDPPAQFLARDAVLAADPQVHLAPYDNDGDGYVDAFVVVHARPGRRGDGGLR